MREKKSGQKVICPKCNNPCSWVSEEGGSVWCYHYFGYEKGEDGKIRKKIKKHYLGREFYVRGRPGEQTLSYIEFEIKEIEERLKAAKDEKEKKKLEEEKKRLEELKQKLQERAEKANIHLRPVSDKDRFLKYIEESLQLMSQQKDFNEDKILQVLDLVFKFLKENKQILSEKTLAKLRLIENDVVNVIYSK